MKQRMIEHWFRKWMDVTALEAEAPLGNHYETSASCDGRIGLGRGIMRFLFDKRMDN